MKASIVVPVYPFTAEVAAMARDNLRAYREHTEGDYELIVVVNGGIEDEAAGLLELADIGVHLVPNRGYSPAVNAGAAQATGDVLVVSSADVKVLPGWLPPLIESAAIHDCIASAYHADHHRYTPYCGVLFSIPKAAWDALDGMDEQTYRIWKGDQDFAIRAHLAGHAPRLVRESEFVHVDPHHARKTDTDGTRSREAAILKERWGAKTYRRWLALRGGA